MTVTAASLALAGTCRVAKSELKSGDRDRCRVDLDAGPSGARTAASHAAVPRCAERHSEAIGRVPVWRLLGGATAQKPPLVGHGRMLRFPPGAEATAAGI